MPRLNNKTRTTELIATDYYDHNQNYISQNSEKVYTQKENLVFWSDFCGDKTGSIQALGDDTFIKVADDRSLNSSDISLFTSKIAKTQVFQQSDSAKFSYLTSRLPRNLRSYLSMKNMSLCGDNCYWLNTTMISAPSKDNNCLATNIGDDKLFIDNISNINFANGDATQDTPFTISIWYHPVDSTQNPQKVYDRGGTLRLNSPAIFHKTFQYGLFIKECGKLEFTLFDVDITSGLTGTTYSYSGTSSTLSVRSSANILKPGEWNHICVTYDGSGTRAGMKIYVNCVDSTNTSDVPSVVASRSRAFSGADKNTWVSTHQAFMSDVLGSAGEGETPADYTAMHTYTTPLIFASTAIPANASSMTGLSKTNMIYARGTQLPNSLLFDIAIWSSALSAEDVGAVCDSTRNCILENSDVFGRDSGYINLSPKIMQKIRDQKQNNLSVIDRVGDRSDRRVKVRQPFNDQHSLIFGSKISDSFKKGKHKFTTLNLTDKEKFYKIPKQGILPDSAKWLVASASIKREQKIDSFGNKIYDKALTFSQAGESFIQSKEKVNNAIIYYDLILGPYNNQLGHLNLTSPKKSGSNLFVEIKTDSSSNWKIIKTHTATDKTSLNEFYSPNFSTGIILTPKQHQFRRSFKIHFTDISANGEPYYVRFRSEDSCWGIGKIEILSANQLVRSPILIDHDSFAGKYIDQNFIATPHTRSDITTTARTLPGISDTSIYFHDHDQSISAFKDNIMIPFAGNTFFNEGIDSNIIPGFASPLKDKTSFTINLDSKIDTDIGFTVKKSGGSAYATANFAQPMFASWDNIDKQWKHTPNSLGALSLGHKTVFLANNLDNQLKFHKQTFGAIDLIGTASGPPENFKFNQFGSDILSSYNQPVTSFGFPHQSVYGIPAGSNNMPVDNLIKMSDYITKPFLLEKVVIEFDAKFEFSEDATTENAFRIMYTSGTILGSAGSNTGPSDRQYDNASIMIPSFYILNVKKNVGKKYSSEVVVDDENILKTFSTPDSSFDYNFAGNKDKVGCDLVTYGQMTMYITGSGMKMDMNKALDDGLGRDAVYDIAKLNGQTTYDLSSNVNPITSSFRIEMPVRNIPKTGFNQRSVHKDTSNNFFGIYSNSPEGGRSLPASLSGSLGKEDSINKALPVTENRGLINNFSTLDNKNKKKYLLGNTEQNSTPYEVTTSGFRLENEIQSTSPYILFPGDRLSLGFAYPVPFLGALMQPDDDETKTNKMTLGGNYKVHFYGSLVKEGKEYHENMNQALTTIGINEPIGCEAVVDKFNIATRDEYFGSYLDKILIGATHLTSPGTTADSSSDAVVYSFENRNTGDGTSRIFGKNKLTPADRISTKIGSKVHHFVTYQVASGTITEIGQSNGSNYVHDFHGSYVSSVLQPGLGTLSKKYTDPAADKHFYKKTFTFPFTEHTNNTRKYADEGKLLLTSSDGTIHHMSGVLGKNQQLESRERYKFSYDHFGHHADMLDTAKDSRYSSIDNTGKVLDLNASKKIFSPSGSPVSIKFVTGSKVKNDTYYYEVEQSNASLNNSISSNLFTYFRDTT